MPTKLVVDCSTGEAVEVELTPEEVAELAAQATRAEAERQAQEAAQAEQEAAKASAVAKLAKLGLSDAEIAALVG